MYKYIMIGKLSIEFSSSMVGKPQNRTEIVTPFFENLGGKPKDLSSLQASPNNMDLASLNTDTGITNTVIILTGTVT